MSKIAFVTEELAVYGKSGGIGAAVFEVAILLREKGHDVDIHYLPTEVPDDDRKQFITTSLAERGIRLIFIDASKYCWQEGEAPKKAYAVYRHLQEYKRHYHFLHFHDYKGLGFFCCAAKRQGVAFHATSIVVQLHGPTRWTTHANRSLFSHQEQLTIDFLERESIAAADHVVSPSAYLIEWMRENDFSLPPPAHVHIIKNVYSHCLKMSGGGRNSDERVAIDEIILFARHEARKGFTVFCDALDILAEQLVERNISVCFVGGLGEINGQPSGVYLTERAKNWKFPLEIRVGFNRMDALTFMRSRSGAVVVIPSPVENSPYTVVEALAAGRAVVTSASGGAKELIDPTHHGDAIVEMEPETLAERLQSLIDGGARVTRFAETANAVENKWIAFHETLHATASPAPKEREKAAPKVVVGVTHFERPRKVIGAIMSVMRQTYGNIELVVVDDGSKAAEALEALPSIEQLVTRVGGRFIRRENGYLGAARNTIAKATQSDYLIFLDDDDLLFPDAIERLVAVGAHTGADIVNCLNVFLDASRRGEYELTPESFEGKVSYVPLGGPLALSHLKNTLGAATALVKRSFFEKLGGYTEIKRVGYEDYEFYVRAAQAKARIEILPEPLYLYEVGKPSMISETSRITNKQRVLDAIDITNDPDAWRDAVELSAGLECIEEERHFVDWQIAASPHREPLQRVFETRGDIAAHISTLSEYAQAVGAPRIAAAWSLALQRPANSDEQKERRLRPFKQVRASRAALPESDELALTAELAGLINIGQIGEAVEAMSAALGRSGEISEAVIEFLHLIATHGDAKANVARPLIDQLAGSLVDERLALRLQGAVASLSITAGLLDEAKALLSEIADFEAEEYLQNYHDLREAFGGAAEHALQHYQKHGYGEGRSGFKTLHRVARDLSKRIGREVHPWQVRYDLDRLLRRSKRPNLSFARLL